MTTITKIARIIEAAGTERRDAIRLSASLPRGADIASCEIAPYEVILPGWYADDGNCEVHCPHADSGRDAAEEYVSDGEWGDDGGSVEVRAWRVRHYIGTDDALHIDEDHESDWHTVDLEPDHGYLISSAAGRATICGTDPDDHDWTREGEGGCDANPGVWSLGGTAMHFVAHCRGCGLTRKVTDPGSQRNPGDGVRYEYEMADDEQIARWRAEGAMDEVEA